MTKPIRKQKCVTVRVSFEYGIFPGKEAWEKRLIRRTLHAVVIYPQRLRVERVEKKRGKG